MPEPQVVSASVPDVAVKPYRRAQSKWGKKKVERRKPGARLLCPGERLIRRPLPWIHVEAYGCKSRPGRMDVPQYRGDIDD